MFLAAVTTLVYSNTFSAPFHFDDNINIVDNPQIKNLNNFSNWSSSRYVGFLSFGLNYHFGELDVVGYHLLNLLIHIANAFLIYFLILLLFKIPINSSQIQHPSPSISDPSFLIALVTASFFTIHPIQTQAVTYIVQRFASLATLFYLLTIVFYLKWRLSTSASSGESRGGQKWLWYAAAILSTILAMKTKETSFTLPFMILLVEFVFFRPIARKIWLTFLPFTLTLPIIPLSVSGALGEGEADFLSASDEITRQDYLLTQFRVIITYLRLLILPINQNLDYDYPIYRSFFEPAVLLSFLFLSLLFGSAVYLLIAGSRFMVRPFSQLISFGILWFFLTLSIESSIIPIGDVIFEHRLYLPSIGAFLVIVVIGYQCFIFLSSKLQPHEGTAPRKYPVLIAAAFLLLLVPLGILTYQRNFIWQNQIRLWNDTISKSPNKPRPHYNLGHAYQKLGNIDEAAFRYHKVIDLDPNHAWARNNLGEILLDRGEIETAIVEFKKVTALDPRLAEGHSNLASGYVLIGLTDKAITEYEAALKLKKDSRIAYNLGLAYQHTGRIQKARRAFEHALEINPDFGLAQKALGHMP